MTNASFTADTPAKVDLFKRRPFAVSLAKSLCLKKDMQGLVIGIEGEWGAGKTSIINFIKSELSNSASKPIVIEFNPWMTSGSKDLVEIMLMQLASALGASSNTKNGMRTAETLVQYAGLLKYLKYLPALSWAGNIAEDATGVASNAIKSIKELVPNLDLAKSKTTVEKALRTLNKPIIVIIDDIDRLTHSEIRHLFQAIKAVADFPRVTYLLAYDLDQITSALDEEYGQNKGQSYIEKIIQISYPIPVIMPLQMMAYTRNKMDDLLSRLAINLKPYERNYWEKALSLIVGLQKTPRDLVRLTNRLVIVIPNTHGEIKICDVVVLEALSLKFPS
ncbi:MAG: P-loop NTPase fold protein, partial [Nitrosomonadales bacterium]|nr:P-loop NTPase fold protein [Nitrosomonadales bacterium]